MSGAPLYQLAQVILANGFEADLADLDEDARDALQPYSTELDDEEVAELARALAPHALHNEEREVAHMVGGGRR